MNISDLVTLGKMGFTRDDIYKLMQSETAQPVSVAQPAPSVVPAAPVAQPAPAAPVAQPAPVATATATTQPDFAAMLSELNKKIDSMSFPQAGQVGEQPQAMSIDDIIAAPFKIPAPQSKV